MGGGRFGGMKKDRLRLDSLTEHQALNRYNVLSINHLSIGLLDRVRIGCGLGFSVRLGLDGDGLRLLQGRWCPDNPGDEPDG